MPKSKLILLIGFIIALLPVLGFPHSWETTFEVLAGLAIVLISVWSSVDKRITLKAKAERRHNKRRALAEPLPETAHPMYGRRSTDIPVDGGKVRFGRRSTDVVLPVRSVTPPPEEESQEFTL